MDATQLLQLAADQFERREPRHPPLYHGTTPLLVEWITRTGIQPGGDGHTYLTSSQAVAWAYAAWAQGLVLAEGTNTKPIPELTTTPIGSKIADALEHGPNICAVATIELPKSTQFDAIYEGEAPKLPWEQRRRDGWVFRLNTPVDAEYIVDWRIYRIPQLLHWRTAGHASQPALDLTPGPVGAEIPDRRRLLAAAIADADADTDTAHHTAHHGVDHWTRVAANGLNLTAPDVDPIVVLLFSILHDACRENDGRDPEHGERAAEFARKLNRDVFTLESKRLDLLAYAIEHHSTGAVTTDPTIGACWDADRLDLQRFGHRIDPALMSTHRGRRLAAEQLERMEDPADTPEMATILDRYAQTVNQRQGEGR
jgi:uncharacterized protein